MSLITIRIGAGLTLREFGHQTSTHRAFSLAPFLLPCLVKTPPLGAEQLYVGEGGFEYLLGYVTIGDGLDPHYSGLWSLSREQEKRNFEQFVDWVMERWRQHPGLHIYHFAPYEPGALKRLMGRYASREEEVDRMLRAKLFVDLFAVVRHAVRAGVESYSIKNLEQFYGYQRIVDLPYANRHSPAWKRALNSPNPMALARTRRR